MAEPRVFSSCIPKEPLIKFSDSGTAPIIDYNLPQETCLDVTTFVTLNIHPDHFGDHRKRVPEGNFWKAVEGMDFDEVVKKLKMAKFNHKESFFRNPELLLKAVVREKILLDDTPDYKPEGKVSRFAAPQYKETVAGYTYEEIAERVLQGYRPVLYLTMYGDVRMKYESEPKEAKPQIMIALHLKMCSFAGNYGTGNTVQTFSLLPGEKTTITVRTYQKNELTQKKSEHILDSFSESVTDELQSQLDHENTFSNNHAVTETSAENIGNSHAYTDGSTTSFNMMGSASLSGGATLGPININVGGSLSLGMTSGGTTSTTDTDSYGSTESSSLNSALSEQIKTLESAINKHVAKADRSRTVEVNTESISVSINEREETTVRQLENINKSRVLNFVFRQIHQEFISITYLNDVSIIFYNGYPEMQRTSKLSGLEMFLYDVFAGDETKIAEAKNVIFGYLCSIYDYTGTRTSFIEQISEDISSCIGESTPNVINYVRKRRDLSQTYRGKTVPGIILNTASRITKTPCVIVDALLGQGEALDCYNMKLQDAAAIAADLQNQKFASEMELIAEQKAKLQAENQGLVLENAKLSQQMSVIDGISDAIDKAKYYKKVFTECCENPQSGCNCCKCAENAETPDNSDVSAGGN